MNEEDQLQDEAGLAPWDFRRHLRSVDPLEVRLSRGFLRCRPEKWLPGFAAHWLPLAHSLGVDLKPAEIKPVMAAPRGMEWGFAATVDDEPLAVFLDPASSVALLEILLPGAGPEAQSVVTEYLARRFITSMAQCWSAESSLVRFDPELNASSLRYAAAIKFSFSLNGNACTVWILAGKLLVERMDGLWRRQLQASTRESLQPASVQLEIAHLAVPPAMLSDYLKSGATIDLEIPASDRITLVVNGEGWLPARLCMVQEQLAFEIVSGTPRQEQIPDGTTRLAISFAAMELDAGQIAELSQVGAMWNTEIPISDQVEMRINGELVGRGTLATFQGRFAVTVI